MPKVNPGGYSVLFGSRNEERNDYENGGSRIHIMLGYLSQSIQSIKDQVCSVLQNMYSYYIFGVQGWMFLQRPRKYV